MSSPGEKLLTSLAAALPGTPGILGVACSGGADSMLLMDLLAELARSSGSTLFVLHVDHGLRQDSHEDLRFVQREAQARDLPFAGVRLRLLARAPGSLEARAREARYAALRNLVSARGITSLCMAHHQDDQVESVLMRILRGSGPRGLGGMLSQRPLTDRCALLRPFLAHPRQLLRKALGERGIRFREDPSNQELCCQRNRLRHQTLPALRQRDRKLDERLLAIGRQARLLARDLAAWAQAARPAYLLHMVPGFQIWRRFALQALPPALCFELLREPLQALAPGCSFAKRASDLLQHLCHAPENLQRVTLKGGILVHKEGPRLLFWSQPAPQSAASLKAPSGRLPCALGGFLTWSWMEGASALGKALRRVRGDPFEVLLEAQALKPPLLVGPAPSGARLRLLGAPGRRPVRRLLRDGGWPALLRSRVPILSDGWGPLWVPPLASAERARLTPASSLAVHLRWEGAPSLSGGSRPT